MVRLNDLPRLQQFDDAVLANDQCRIGFAGDLAGAQRGALEGAAHEYSAEVGAEGRGAADVVDWAGDRLRQSCGFGDRLVLNGPPDQACTGLEGQERCRPPSAQGHPTRFE
mgnify:CR=1 FL=1